MNYSNGKPIGCNYSGDQASDSGYGTIGRCTIGMTFEELQKTWRIRKHIRNDDEDDCPDSKGIVGMINNLPI